MAFKPTGTSSSSKHTKTVPKISPVDKSSKAWSWFKSFIDGTQLDVTESELIEYLKTELDIDVEGLPPDLYKGLPLMLVVYMRVWSGWSFKGDYLLGSFSMEHYFARFQKFLHYKINMVLNTGYSKAIKEVRKEEEEEERLVTWQKAFGSSTQIADKSAEFAKFSVNISCPPSMVNTLVFTANDDDIILKSHVGTDWKKDLTMSQLLNWPFVEVTLTTPVISLVRSQSTEFMRYLNYTPAQYKRLDDKLVESVHCRTDALKNRTVFTRKMVEAYMSEYLGIISKDKNIPEEKCEEIFSIFTQFLEDIRVVNINKETIATNTQVLFRLSNASFIRNKKLSQKTTVVDTNDRVGYCEVLIPKIEFMLTYFRATQVLSPKGNDTKPQFEQNEILKRLLLTNNKSQYDNIIPTIHYKCKYCQKVFAGLDSKKKMMTHLKETHKMEQPVRCTQCKKQFDVTNLAECRWKHICLSLK